MHHRRSNGHRQPMPLVKETLCNAARQGILRDKLGKQAPQQTEISVHVLRFGPVPETFSSVNSLRGEPSKRLGTRLRCLLYSELHRVTMIVENCSVRLRRHMEMTEKLVVPAPTVLMTLSPCLLHVCYGSYTDCRIPVRNLPIILLLQHIADLRGHQLHSKRRQNRSKFCEAQVKTRGDCPNWKAELAAEKSRMDEPVRPSRRARTISILNLSLELRPIQA